MPSPARSCGPPLPMGEARVHALGHTLAKAISGKWFLERHDMASPWGGAGTAIAVTDVGNKHHTRPYGPPSPQGEGLGNRGHPAGHDGPGAIGYIRNHG